jgi:hypothetical protein
VEVVHHDVLTFAPSKGDEIQGSITSGEGKSRNWNFQGNFQENVLIMSYGGESQGRSGGVAFVLQGDPWGGALKGYYLGTDPELGKIVAGPYVLTNNPTTTETDSKYSSWLSQPLYYYK